jgi:transposase
VFPHVDTRTGWGSCAHFGNCGASPPWSVKYKRTGCPWRYLPRDGFPPRSTVYNIFHRFQAEGRWEAIWAELHMSLRERLGREASPSAAVLDSQTIKSAEKGARKITRWVTTPANA